MRKPCNAGRLRKAEGYRPCRLRHTGSKRRNPCSGDLCFLECQPCWNSVLVVIAFVLFLSSTGCILPQLNKAKVDAAKSRKLQQEGATFYEQGDWENAEKKLSEAVKINEKDMEIRGNYAESLWQMGKKQQAIAQLTEAVRVSQGKDVKIMLSLAEKCYDMGDYDTAFDCAEQTIFLASVENKSIIDQAWVIRARVNWRRGHLQQALNDYHKAISLNAKDPVILSELASLQETLGMPDRALVTWQSVSRLYPPDQEPQQVVFGRGNAYMAMQLYHEANDQFVLANKRWPQNVETYCRLTEAKLACGQIQDAAQVAKLAIEIAPDNQDCLAVQKNVEIALSHQRPLMR